MKRARGLGALAAATLAATALAPLHAGAADGDPASSALTATVTAGSVGARTVTSAPIAMTSALNSTTLSGAYSVVVTEAARTGTNPWSVTAVLDADLVDGANTIPRSSIALSNQAVVQVASGGTSSAAGAQSGTLDSARTLFTNTGQNTTSVYTGTHTATGTVTLTPPNGSKTGIYAGTFTVTLVQ